MARGTLPSAARPGQVPGRAAAGPAAATRL